MAFTVVHKQIIVKFLPIEKCNAVSIASVQKN